MDDYHGDTHQGEPVNKNVQEPQVYGSSSSDASRVRARRPWTSLIVALVVIIVLLVGAVGYLLGTRSQTSSTSVATSSSPTTKTRMTARQALDGAKHVVKGEILRADDGNGGINHYLLYSFAARPADGGKFTVPPAKGDGFGVAGDRAATAANYQAMDSYFSKAGFTEHDRFTGAEGDSLIGSVVFEKDDAVCSIHQSNYGSGAPFEYATGVGCADVADYDAQAKAMQPFYDALMAANDAGIGTDSIGFGPLTINNGNDGYHNAYVGINSILGLFYQGPDKTWHYFTGSNGIIGCEKFNTAALRKAFANEDCATQTGITKLHNV